MLRLSTGLAIVLAVVAVQSAGPAAAAKDEPVEPDVSSMLASSSPQQLLAAVHSDIREDVENFWYERIARDAALAASMNSTELYHHPVFQGYLNRLGQDLVPKEAADDILLSFKIVRDPIPRSFSLATGSVFISTGLISVLENETELAFVLAHEAGHVLLSHHLRHIIEVQDAARRQERNAKIGAAIGAIVGGLAAAQQGASGTDVALAATGAAAVGTLAGSSIGRFREPRFSNEIQREADLLATEMMLRYSLDPRLVAPLMNRVMQLARLSGPSLGLSFADPSNLTNRKSSLLQLVNNEFRSVVATVEAAGFRRASPHFERLLGELSRDNGFMAYDLDLFAVARANFENAVAIRPDDPLVSYGLGLVFRAVGRTQQERAAALGHFRRAIELDGERNRLPVASLQYGTEMILAGHSESADIQHALKTYVAQYQEANGGNLPPEMNFVYDYLELAGEKKWTARPVINVYDTGGTYSDSAAEARAPASESGARD